MVGTATSSRGLWECEGELTKFGTALKIWIFFKAHNVKNMHPIMKYEIFLLLYESKTLESSEFSTKFF